MGFFSIGPVDVSPKVAGWQDIDASPYIAANATGVILHICPGGNVVLRKKGSTDYHGANVGPKEHTWAAIGVDSNGVFQAVAEYATLLLIGYTTDGVTFFTNSYDKSPLDLMTWAAVDCSVEAPNAIGLIFEVLGVAPAYLFGIRKNGSTDSRASPVAGHNCFSVIIGCDENQICEIHRQNEYLKFYLVGYITSGAEFYTNAPDISLSVTGAWTDLPALPPGSVMGFVEIHTPGFEKAFGLRKNGSIENIYLDTHDRLWAFVGCDHNGVIEGKIEGTMIDFYLTGYATGEVAPLPSRVTGLNAENIADRSFRLSWAENPPAEEISSYRTYITKV